MESIISANNKLSIRFTSDGFSLYIKNDQGQLISTETVEIDIYNKSSADIIQIISSNIEKITNTIISEIIIESDHYNLLPDNTFDKADISDIFQFYYPEATKANLSHKTYKLSNNIDLLFGINKVLENAINSLFPNAIIKHHITNIIEHQIDFGIICNIRKNRIDLIVNANNIIIYCNYHEFSSNEDILYHLLNTNNQLLSSSDQTAFLIIKSNNNPELTGLLNAHIKNIKFSNTNYQ